MPECYCALFSARATALHHSQGVGTRIACAYIKTAAQQVVFIAAATPEAAGSCYLQVPKSCLVYHRYMLQFTA